MVAMIQIEARADKKKEEKKKQARFFLSSAMDGRSGAAETPAPKCRQKSRLTFCSVLGMVILHL